MGYVYKSKKYPGCRDIFSVKLKNFVHIMIPRVRPLEDIVFVCYGLNKKLFFLLAGENVTMFAKGLLVGIAMNGLIAMFTGGVLVGIVMNGLILI